MRWSGHIAASGVAVLALGIALAWMIPAAALAQEVETTAEVLEERISELRLRANYAEAAEVALELVALRKEDPETRPSEIEDAERLVETLQHIAGLPDEAKRELALADSLTDVEAACREENRYSDAAAAAQQQLEIRRRLLGSKHPDITISLNELAVDLYIQGDYAGAELLLREALVMRKELLGTEHPDVAESLNNLATCLQTQSDYAGAEPFLRDAVAVWRRSLGDEHPDVASGVYNLASLLHAQGKYAGAEPLYREALAMRRRLLGDEHPDVALSLNGLAVVHYSQGDYAGAEPLFREALAMRRRLLGDEHPYVAASLSNLAYVLGAQGDHAGAEPLSREALAMRRKLFGDEHPSIAGSLNSLADHLKAQGDYAGAEPLYREALAMRRKLLGDEHLDVARSLNGLAVLLNDQGDYVDAEPLYRESLAMLRRLLGDEHPDVAGSLNNLAVLLNARGDYAGAEALYREALALRRRLFGDEHAVVATSLNSLAAVLHAQGDYAGAEPLHREALAMFRRLLGDEHPDVAMSLNNLAALLRDRRDYAGAEPLHREALAMWRKLLGNEHPNVVASLNNLADVFDDQGDHASAEPLLAEAARVYDAARLRAGAGLKRAAFRVSPYPRLASVRLALGRTDEAWPAAERAHARSLADLLMATEERDLSPSEVAREDSLSRILGTLERELTVYRETVPGDTTGEAAGLVEATRNALLAAESEWSAFQQTMVTRYPVTEGETFPLERVQSSLSSESAIIGWLDIGIGRAPEFKSWCYAIRNSGPVMWARVGPSPDESSARSPLERTRSFRSQLATPATPDAVVTRESRGLWRDRVGPLLGALEGVEKLIVVPSGAMLGVPIEALVDNEGATVGETYAVSYVPSATLQTWLAERADRDVGSRTLLVGDPPYSPAHLAAMQEEQDVLLASAEPSPGAETLRSALAGNADALRALPRLHGTRDEVAAIAEVSRPSSMLLGPEASEQELVRLAESGELGEFGTIHIATHALVDDERPERSALVLSQVDLPDALEAAMAGTRIYDGLVTAEDILREWDLNADLVTLSACETGLGKKVMGEGYVGFAHSLLQAGARSLLVSLWKVEDTATSLLMRRFYENRLGRYEDERMGRVGEPMSKAEALQDAKRWLREYTDEHGNRPYDHPYFWSAFILIGDPS
ncbi:MAG: CHAT domain-containing tetratricopeptide repeat protein [Candidatus Eisenbacteria bacterium]